MRAIAYFKGTAYYVEKLRRIFIAKSFGKNSSDFNARLFLMVLIEIVTWTNVQDQKKSTKFWGKNLVQSTFDFSAADQELEFWHEHLSLIVLDNFQNISTNQMKVSDLIWHTDNQ